MAKSQNEHFDITWTSYGYESTEPSNPDYPHGISVDGTNGKPVYCVITLPYPAKEPGFHGCVCKLCGFSIAITAVGRADDPKQVKVPCKLKPSTTVQ